MDHANAPPSWVETAVIEMKASREYQTKVYDELYQTLPVPAWNAQRNWLVVGFGTNSRTGGPLGPVKSQPPYIACVVSYPDGKRHWALDDNAARVWPTQRGLPELALPASLAGNPMDRRRLYYRALSDALQQGAFAAHAPVNAAKACTAARAAREAFLPASPFPNLLPFYAAPLNDMDGWLAAHCGRP
ncbi:MAG TPA: hypothetical protein VF457_00105 [Burkholderiaceae bacterium]